MCKKRKEKKLNMQGKDNMMLDCFIINIHMQLRRERLDHNSSYFLKPRGEARYNTFNLYSQERFTLTKKEETAHYL